ncbi:MAG: MotA/TolQ/ExbB proton channel family protein [Planctomycetota bacterium]|nr:flagellar motor stator protein MotA [Planctomycetota bacterium]MCX8039749.1 flagellar motor stator protein MotA [Planctomycetota bacterium]MDW8373225.1 MotA/TolQ/ExbB proton channel family protein [Planctomycetota bacterium]
MITFIGIIFGLICVFTGYILHHGSMMVFVAAWTEFIVIIGGAVGIFIAANGMTVVKRTIGEILGLLKPNPFESKEEYMKLLVMMYQLFSVARRDGLLGLESHMEDPHKSPIISKNHTFLHHHHCAAFFCDTMKVVISGGVSPHDLAEMMEIDIEAAKNEAHVIPEAVSNAADAMPAVGIVACVLGVIVVMGQIGGEPAAIGKAIAVALVGTFLGILVSYLIVGPIARAIAARHRTEENYLQCMKHALFSFARGESPITCVEFARRQIEPSIRPGFSEMEKALKAAKSG